MSRIVALLATACAFGATAVTATAQVPPPGTPPPTGPILPTQCLPNQAPTPDNPCIPPPCAQGQVPTPELPCIGAPSPGGLPGTGPFPGGPGTFPGGPGTFPGGPGTFPGGPGTFPGGPGQGPGGPGNFPGGPGQGPGGPGQGGGGPGGPPQCEPEEDEDDAPSCPGPGFGGGLPVFAPTFLSKVWRFAAEVGHFDAAGDVLNVTVTEIKKLPPGLAAMGDEIVDQDAYVLFPATTRVYDKGGKRIKKESRYDGLLDDADTVEVSGKVVKPDKWQKDEDDIPVVTIRAKRVKISG